MSILRSMMSVNFIVNKQGETTFFHPVLFGGAWCPRKGYRITSDEDVATLKRCLTMSYGILVFVLVPIVVVVVSVLELLDGNLLLALLLGCAVFGLVYELMVDRLFIRSVVRNYEPTEERLRFSDFQQLQAESRSWFGLISSALFSLFFSLAGLFGVMSGLLAVEAGVLVVLILSSFGAQAAYQIVLKRQGNTGPDRC